MTFESIAGGFRLDLRPPSLVHALTAIGALRFILALTAGGGRTAASSAVEAGQWILCASSMILIAVCERDVREHHPGVTSLFRDFSYGAIAGSLLPNAANLVFFKGSDAAPQFAVELLGLALTLLSAKLLEWLLRENDRDLAPVPESEVMARLAALIAVMKYGSWESSASATTRWHSITP